MAFNSANLVGAEFSDYYGNKRSVIWDYSTSDDLSTVEDSSYFGSARGAIRQMDILRVTANDGKAEYVVLATSGFDGATVSLQKTATVTSFTSL